MTKKNNCVQYVENISESGLSIYDPIEISNSKLWIPSNELETILNNGLVGISLSGLPLRTRSKCVKKHICRILGYPVPQSFRKTKPQFPGQNFHVCTQKKNNVQIYNEKIILTRRYIIIRISEKHIIEQVKVITGNELALLDTTGTITKKYQAKLIPGDIYTELIAKQDTEILRPLVRANVDLSSVTSPTREPVAGQLLPIQEIYERLKVLVGMSFNDAGYVQERNRGAILHRLVCEHLGYPTYRDDGQFPDLKHQLLEIKLQTSPTVDLGLICPDSMEALDISRIEGRQIRHCDIRYALFYAEIKNTNVTLTHFYLTTGESFFTRFRQFGGKVINKKIQIPLPRDFFA